MKKAGLLLLLCYSLCASGQPLISNLEKYTIDDGLSSNEISSLLQDYRGFLWIGTDWGLNRYDGRSFKQYTRTGNNGLIHYAINSLAEDKQGNIWIATNKGISRFDPLTETFVSWPRPGNVFADKQKNIWILNHDSICLFNNGKVEEKYVIDVTTKDPNANRYILSMTEDRKGELWLVASNGLHKLNRSTRKLQLYTSTPGGDDACTISYEDKDGDIWSGTWGEGLLKVNRQTGSLLNTQLDAEYSNSIFGINDIRLGGRDFLLLATAGNSGGLLLCEKTKGPELIRVVKKIADPGTEGALSINFKSIVKDRQQNFWIASSDGIYKIDISRQSFRWSLLPGAAQSNHVLFHGIASPAANDSSIYISSMEGWWKLDTRDLSIHPHALPETNKNLALFINRYVADKNGWWFTSQQGFGFYDLQANRIIDYSTIDGADKPITRCWGLVRDKKGKLWISVYRAGLAIYDPVKKTTTRLFNTPGKDDLRGTSIVDFRIDSTGMIWMTTNTKLYRINPADHSYTSYALPAGDSPGLLISSTNRIIIHTEQALFEWKNEQINKIFQKEMLIRQFGEDDDGNFWLQSHNNFYRVSPDFTRLVSYTSGSGLNGRSEITEMSFYDNRCLILSKGKLLCFETDKIDRSPSVSPVVISSVTANQEKYYFPAATRGMRLNYKERLEIEIAALNLSNEGDNRIFYQLQGWDDQWKELVSGSVLSYEQLPAGRYSFLVTASNGDTELTIEPVRLDFRILPPFWKRWWFIGLLAITIAGITYWFYRYRLAQAIKMERLRTRIATDLHDDIGATLSSISMYSEAVKNQVKDKLPQLETVLEKMGENSRNMVSSMNDIVWAVNPGNDQGEKLLERMEAYARDACAVKDIKLHFQCNPEWNQHSFSLEYRKNIYLVFKEALNNALKYSAAGNIWITIDKKATHLHLLIRDDGKGFDTGNSNKGNGLKNMQTRAKEIGAVIKIESGDNGTSVFLDCKPL